ncbi:hypothetical protein BRADI_3g38380v3 [Brachypodium distachyon]|uniref:Impact N-terminal domain-containing protein n=1 Tax=Brachypodium distachyon TaxID=15368 RepID=A0A0Q3QAF4_BRADI|nr:hypothetical protein BRADI_3g38380v3 [Brachypodium distachyon]
MAAVRVVTPRLRSIPLLLPGPVHHSCSCRSSAASSVRDMSSSSASSSPSPYTALVGRVRCEREIKRSKFIAIAGTVHDERAAMSFLDEVKDPRATHNCWAYKVGEQFRYNDDGEPSSTAGKPIYSAIISSGIDMVMVVVISCSISKLKILNRTMTLAKMVQLLSCSKWNMKKLRVSEVQ